MTKFVCQFCQLTAQPPTSFTGCINSKLHFCCTYVSSSNVVRNAERCSSDAAVEAQAATKAENDQLKVSQWPRSTHRSLQCAFIRNTAIVCMHVLSCILSCRKHACAMLSACMFSYAKVVCKHTCVVLRKTILLCCRVC